MVEHAGVLTNAMSIKTGRVVGFEPEGRIRVELAGAAPVSALFLRTTPGPPPRFDEGRAVLLAVGADGGEAYVLGLVEPYTPEEEREEEHPGGPVEIALPANADRVRLRGRRIYIEAGEEVELTCGGGTIRIDQRGKIVVRGNQVVSRARGTNKIKGASVAIN